MKIVHLCLGCFYIEGYSYQENILPKYHKRMGHDVEIIASLESFDSRGRHICLPPNQPSFINEHGIKVTRLNYKYNGKLRKLKRFEGLLDALRESSPELLFIHGCQFCDMDIVVKYLKSRGDVRVFVDNHADYSNSATNFISKHLLHRFFWKRSARMILPYVENFWGVLPARVDFLTENYGIPPEKCKLLVMGADDDEVARALEESNRCAIRRKYGIGQEDFLLVTGGKIDRFKTQILNLMEAVWNDERQNVKLLVFGPIDPDLQSKANQYIDNKRVIYVPWADSSQSYDFFASADLVVFPGRHSVYWEQVAGLGKPLIVKRWEKTTHIDFDGNVVYTSGDDSASLKNDYGLVIDNRDRFDLMKDAALKAKSVFSYSDIAKRSIDLNG